MTPAEQWSSSVIEAMDRRGLTTLGLARKTQVSPHTVRRWRRGLAIPRMDTAARAADVLFYPSLLDIVRKARTRVCDFCGREFMDDGNAIRARYCSRRHESAYRNREARPVKYEAFVTRKHDAVKLQTAVDAYCWGCEPEGVCRTPECELRGVSPLKLERRLA